MLEHNTCMHMIMITHTQLAGSSTRPARRQGQVGGVGLSPSTPARQTLAAVAGDAAKAGRAWAHTLYAVLIFLPSPTWCSSSSTLSSLSSSYAVRACVRFGNELEYNLELTPHSRPAVPFNDRARRKKGRDQKACKLLGCPWNGIRTTSRSVAVTQANDFTLK